MKLNICLYFCFRFYQRINVIKPT